MDVPDEPENDPLTAYVIDIFTLASRARRYAIGAVTVPLPLSVADISVVVEAHGLVMDRRMLDACVMALDVEWMEGV